MDSNLEYKILLSEKSEQNKDYPWSLEECDKEGKKIKGDFIRSLESFDFTASELRLESCNFLHIETGKDTESPAIAETISGVLHPQVTSAFYSMFGTNSEVICFKLNIKKNKNPDDKAKCHLEGFINSSPNTDDYICVHLSLTPQQFNQIAEIIKSNNMDGLTIILYEPSGFYSKASTETLWGTDCIKILTNSEEHKVVIQDGCKINPPRLGEVHFFNISIIQRHYWQKDKEDEGAKEDNEEIQKPKLSDEKESAILFQLKVLEIILGIPLWFIASYLFGKYILPDLIESISKAFKFLSSFF
ncbi:TPA: hypothetical protein ACT96X_001012 [Legionella pneumophila]|uniref:hypothetical protein n=1 Tax=Legionella pneumophila TaxID=446 RepID=UPI0007875DD3|nr:hypothetical protein [Legionella pneumophila]HAT1987241.1 hypothetical protein [Legionella pneumophila]HAT8744810.1 hypothetical protein [Legionella pneumophila]HAU1190888.1 hypothetical protein [Legionella pneumophila]HBD7101600.1 hypothetical protein [Legionella pneumophila]HBD7170692.1 hypothetical protein [Legionella pneumophila]